MRREHPCRRRWLSWRRVERRGRHWTRLLAAGTSPALSLRDRRDKRYAAPQRPACFQAGSFQAWPPPIVRVAIRVSRASPAERCHRGPDRDARLARVLAGELLADCRQDAYAALRSLAGRRRAADVSAGPCATPARYQARYAALMASPAVVVATGASRDSHSRAPRCVAASSAERNGRSRLQCHRPPAGSAWPRRSCATTI